jgi:hypothetical protein
MKRKKIREEKESEDEQLHAAVAQSRFGSQKVQKHCTSGALLGAQMFKKCTLLWRQAHVEVKM